MRLRCTTGVLESKACPCWILRLGFWGIGASTNVPRGMTSLCPPCGAPFCSFLPPNVHGYCDPLVAHYRYCFKSILLYKVSEKFSFSCPIKK